MKLIEKSPVPGLSRGLRVMKLLFEKGSGRLEDISQASGLPKSSLFRILRTLEIEGFVKREPVSKEYFPLLSFIPLIGESANLESKIRGMLGEISRATCRTAEFYVPEGDCLRLIFREESESYQVVVKATIGFKRDFYGEFEAVARIAHSFIYPSPGYRSSLWIYKDGTKKKLSERNYKIMLESARKDGSAIDFVFNPNGVRRSAAPFFIDGRLAGVFAIAENFIPSGDRESLKNLDLMKKIIAKMD